MGNRNWMRAREAMLTSHVDPGRHRPALFPICTPRRVSDSASRSTKCWNCCTWVAAVVAARGADDDPGSRGRTTTRTWTRPVGATSTSYHATFMEPWDGPANGVVHRRHASSAPCSTATDCARAGSGSPTTVWSSWRPRRACWNVDPAARSCERGACSPAACSWWTRPQGRILEDRRDQVRSRWRPSSRTTNGCGEGIIHLRRSSRPGARRLQRATSILRRQQTFGYTEEEVRDPRWAPMAKQRCLEPIGSMGTDTPDRRAISERSRLCCSTTSPSCSPR